MTHRTPAGKWQERFFRVAEEVASWSKDGSTKVGAVVVDRFRHIKGTGYNGFARGVRDDIAERHQRPEKYLWTIHAEPNAILSCDQRPLGADLYCTLMPCMGCANIIVQSGVTRVLVDARRSGAYAGNYTPEFTAVEQLFLEAGIDLLLVTRDPA